MSVSALKRLEEAVGAAAGTTVALERPADPSHGDYATNIALRLAGARKQAPRAIAEELVTQVAGLPGVERAEVAGPGFVNLSLEPAWYGDALAEILAAGDRYGAGSAAKPEKIQVELVSANPTGPVTVAAARNGAYGDSVARLLEYAGHDVEREYYFNDVGKQMDRFRASVDAVRRGEDPPEDGYHGEYIAGLAAIEGDPVPPMLKQIETTLSRFRIDFDSFQNEAGLVELIPAAIARLDTYEAEGTLWARTSAFGDDKDRPLLRSSDGSHLYFAADVAYLVHKLDTYGRALYVLGADHHGYVSRLEAVAEMLGYGRGRVEVLLYQLVNLTRGGEATKMSKRRGDVVFLDDFVDEIGVDAARWYLVNRGHDQTIEIDIELAAEKSAKNPVYYVQYAHARIASILRSAADAEVSPVAPAEVAPEERDLIKSLAEFPAVVAEATDRRAPHALPHYAIRLADDFHRFYHEHKVLGAETQAFRLALVTAVKDVIFRSLDLVGVEAPDSM